MNERVRLRWRDGRETIMDVPVDGERLGTYIESSDPSGVRSFKATDELDDDGLSIFVEDRQTTRTFEYEGSQWEARRTGSSGVARQRVGVQFSCGERQLYGSVNPIGFDKLSDDELREALRNALAMPVKE